jgi:TonB family protein
MVESDGHASSVEVQQSSGHEILDNAARECVAKWTFPPESVGPICYRFDFAIPK